MPSGEPEARPRNGSSPPWRRRPVPLHRRHQIPHSADAVGAPDAHFILLAHVAIDFWHENCTWCNCLDPLYQQVAKDHQGKIKFAKLHVFRENEIATRYGITGTPTIKFFCAGRESSEICRCGLALPLLLPGTVVVADVTPDALWARPMGWHPRLAVIVVAVAGVYMESRLRGLPPQITATSIALSAPPLSLGTLTLTFESIR